jgi:hypothetical protein
LWLLSVDYRDSLRLGDSSFASSGATARSGFKMKLLWQTLTFSLQLSHDPFRVALTFGDRDLTAANDGNTGMAYAAFALAVMGGAIGSMFRFKILLPVVALLVPASIVFSVTRGFGFLDTALTMMAAQTILQASYFLGLVIRNMVGATHRVRPIL